MASKSGSQVHTAAESHSTEIPATCIPIKRRIGRRRAVPTAEKTAGTARCVPSSHIIAAQGQIAAIESLEMAKMLTAGNGRLKGINMIRFSVIGVSGNIGRVGIARRMDAVGLHRDGLIAIVIPVEGAAVKGLTDIAAGKDR